MRRRRLLSRSLLVAGGLVALGLGVALLVGQAVGYSGLVSRLRSADPAWLALGVLAETVSLIAYAAVVRGAAQLDQGPRLRYATSAHLAFAGLGASRVAPGGSAGAAALDYWALTRAGADRSGAASRVLALFTLVFGIFGVGAWVAALLLAFGVGGSVARELTIPWLVAVPALLAAAAWFRGPRSEVRWLGKAGTVLYRVLREATAGLALARHAAARPREHLPVLTAGLLYWAGDAACLWASLRAFEVSVPPAALALAYATGYLFTLLPLPLGGVGAVDAAMVVTVGAVGVPFSAALLGVLAFRAISFWLPTPVGIAAVSTLPRLKRALDRERT